VGASSGDERMTGSAVQPGASAPEPGAVARGSAEQRDDERSDAEHRDAEDRDAEHRDAEHRDAEHRDAEHRDAKRRSADQRWSQYSRTWAEYAQDVLSAIVAVILIALAAAILVAGVVTFLTKGRHHGLTLDALTLLDQVLLVLILVEVVHTVVLSLEAHSLAAQPFLVVGLVAVIRKILFSLGTEQKLSTSTLALYIAMVAVFAASLVAVEAFGGRRRARTSGEEGPPAR
jgi:uncharacterized membrane protein (DUF373 family)